MAGGPLRYPTSLAAGTLLVGLLVAPGAGPASATGLGISSFRDIVVDQAHSTIFVSGGALATANLSGTPTGSVAGISVARQMTMTPDGTQLVVANADGLSVVDTATATVVRTISVGPNSCPEAVTPAAGKIFFTYGDCEGGTPGLGAVDLSDDTITTNISTGTVVLSHTEEWAPRPSLKSVAAAPTTLVLRAGNTLAVFDATGGSTPTVTVRASKITTGVAAGQLAVNPSGSEVLLGDGYSATDLTKTREFSGTSAPAAAFRADGRLARAPGSSADVNIYAPGATVGTPLDVTPNRTNLYGLAYATERLYAVVVDYDDPIYSVVLAPVGPPAAMTITTDHYTYNYKATATVTIKLTSPTHSRSVSLFARTEGHDLRFIKKADVSASTRALVVKVPGLIYNTTFLAKFAGDDVFAAKSVTRAVKVRAKLVISSSSTSVVNGYHRLHPSPAPIITFQVYPNHPHQCLRISGMLLVNGTWRDLSWNMSGCVRTNANSRLAIKLIGFERGDRVQISGIYSNGGCGCETVPGGAGNVDSLRVSYRVVMY